MWKQFWNTLQERPKMWTLHGKSALFGLIILLATLSGIMVISFFVPESAAEICIISLVSVMIGFMVALPFLFGRLVAAIFMPDEKTPPRDPVINLVLLVTFSTLVVTSIVYWTQMGMLTSSGQLGTILSLLISSLSVPTEWLYFADAFIIVAVAAFHLSEEL